MFNPDPHADTSVGWLEFKFFLGAAFSIALACMYLSLAAFVYQDRAWAARLLVWLVSYAALPFTWLAYVRNGVSYIHAQGTGPDFATTIEEMNRVNDLTPWRFSGWYHNITIGFGIALTIFIIGAVILLAVPSSNTYFLGIYR